VNPSIASFVYACGIAGLFYLDRDTSVRTSKALWLPVVYLAIIGSRPLSAWLGIAPPPGADVQLDGSPVDRAFFAVLWIAAICVLVGRGRKVSAFLKANGPILAYFLFCLLSVSWSDFPGVALKRWVKAVGDLLMILIVLTDEQPIAAIRRLLSRTGFVLIPLSLLLAKYYPEFGTSYDQWSGSQFVVGATLNKNVLGVITFVLLLGAVWRIVTLLRAEEKMPDRRRHLAAQCALLAMGIYVLKLADSDTALVAFLLGAGLLCATSSRFFKRNASAVHVLVAALIVIVCWLTLVGGFASITHALGRKSNLTGRTDVWAAVIPLAGNPLVGAGFESFWLSPRVHQRLWELFPGLPLNEAHDGYLEVYLELGWIGVGLIAIVLLDGYRRAVKAFRREPMIGGLLLAYILSGMVYSIAEAGFRMLDPIWIFLLLAIVEASRVAVGAEATHDFSDRPPIETASTVMPGARKSVSGKSSGTNPLNGTQPYGQDAGGYSKVKPAFRPH
jgi:exopolysaccharide production protein ExoQ